MSAARSGYPIVIDWATSVVALGRVQQLKREGKQLPPPAAVDKDGIPTTNPAEAVSVLPFGAHKGYGLSLINEIVGGFIGGSLPTIRNRWDQVDAGDKGTCCFFFQVIPPRSDQRRGLNELASEAGQQTTVKPHWVEDDNSLSSRPHRQGLATGHRQGNE